MNEQFNDYSFLIKQAPASINKGKLVFVVNGSTFGQGFTYPFKPSGFYYSDGTKWIYKGATATGSGTVTSVDVTATTAPALSTTGGPITTAGIIDIAFTGATTDYVDGTGALQVFPTIPVVTPSALTKTDDTNVTLTLGGAFNTALLQATSLTLGWTGQLSIARGGTGGSLYAGLDLLLTSTVSAQATVDYDFNPYGSTYKQYIVKFEAVQPSTNNVGSLIRVGTGAGPTYQSGTGAYNWNRIFYTAGGVSSSNATDNKILWGGNGAGHTTTANRKFYGWIQVVNPTSTTDYHVVFVSCFWVDNGGNLVAQEVWGQYLSSTQVTGLQLAFSSGNINGIFNLYGIR